MPAPRLNDSQKEELVARYRQGETAQALAVAYGCSPNTVSRVLKAALPPQEMEAIKRQARGGRSADEVAPPSNEEGSSPQAAEDPGAEPEPEVALAAEVEVDGPGAAAADPEPEAAVEPDDAADDRPVAAEQSELAIDDADDFAEDGLDDADSDDGDDPADEASVAFAAAVPPGVVLEAQPLSPGDLPASVYMLVDKTVELQAKPLREFPELGSLPDEEQERQALMLFTNPRQAKRQCGRTQRVIKVPDAGVLERRSSYLVAQGITRLVVEGGSLYAL